MALPSLSDLFDLKEEKNLLGAILFPFAVKGFEKGVELTAFNNGTTTEPDDVMNVSIMKGLKSMSLKHAAKSAKTSQKNLKKVIETTLEQEGTVQDLAKNIKASYGIQVPRRSLMIARTELTGVISNGALRTLAHEGYTEKKWITNIDGRERESHAAINGQVRKLESDFSIGGAYPGDSSLQPEERIHCRCTLIGVGIPEFSLRSVHSRFLTIHGSIERRFVLQLRRYFRDQRERILSRL